MGRRKASGISNPSNRRRAQKMSQYDQLTELNDKLLEGLL